VSGLADEYFVCADLAPIRLDHDARVERSTSIVNTGFAALQKSGSADNSSTLRVISLAPSPIAAGQA
jgi:hypothetical protein